MVNPLLTILFQIFLVTSAAVLVVGLIAEQRMFRTPHAGRPPTLAPARQAAPARQGGRKTGPARGARTPHRRAIVVVRPWPH